MIKSYKMSEFIRYVIVGGSAFIVDIFIIYIFKNFVFSHLCITGIYISTALGFIAGLIYNYILSLTFVFDEAKNNNRGKSIRSFIIFTLIGFIGLLITELGMYMGVQVFLINYLIVKIFVSGIVLIWNYSARKILIFRQVK